MSNDDTEQIRVLIASHTCGQRRPTDAYRNAETICDCRRSKSTGVVTAGFPFHSTEIGEASHFCPRFSGAHSPPDKYGRCGFGHVTTCSIWLPSGAKFREILRAIEDAPLEGFDRSREEALEYFAKLSPVDLGVQVLVKSTDRPGKIALRDKEI